MKNKITQIIVARFVDNTVITISRDNNSNEYQSDSFDESISEDSVQRFYSVFNPLLKAGAWKVIDIGEYGTWDTGLTVVFEPVEPVHSLEDVQVTCSTCGLPKLSGYWLNVYEEYRKCSDCIMAEIKQKENQK